MPETPPTNDRLSGACLSVARLSGARRVRRGAARGRVAAPLVALVLSIGVPSALAAQSASRWTLRVAAVLSGSSHASRPEGYEIYSGIGLEAAVARSLGERLSIEMAMRTESREVTGPGEAPLGSIELLPVSLVALWHPVGPLGAASRLRPEIGAGASFAHVWEKSGSLDSSDVPPAFDPLLRVGTAVRLSERAALRLSATWSTLEVELRDLPSASPVISVDPLTLGLGVGVGL